MKPFLAFTYYVGRPLGGMHDFLDRFETVEAALENILAEPDRYYQIVDADSGRIVKQGLALYKDFASDRFTRDDSA